MSNRQEFWHDVRFDILLLVIGVVAVTIFLLGNIYGISAIIRDVPVRLTRIILYIVTVAIDIVYVGIAIILYCQASWHNFI